MNSLWSKGFEHFLKKFLRKYTCHECGGDLYFFNGGAYNNPSLEAIYRCKKCTKVNYLMLTDCCTCKDAKAVPIDAILEDDGELIENYLGKIVNDLEPSTHCCECTPGAHQDKHEVHIQYPDCSCRRENYVLNKNGEGLK